MSSNDQHRAKGEPVTIRTLRRMARAGEPFACLTCYDATTARILESAGVHVLLVGDTAAEMILGYDSTIHMPLEVAIALTAGVKRGAPGAFVMGDMPFMSYQASADDAVRNAGRFLTEGLADIVKLEGDASFAPLVKRMTRSGIPVCGHVGCRPQSVKLSGGYQSTGRTAETARTIVEDAEALAEAGCTMLLVEAVPGEIADRIMERTPGIPLIGIGAGSSCHGQILVLQDLLGLTHWQPGFATPVASMGQEIERAARVWIERVSRRGVTDHRYEMKAGESDKLRA
ncbi:MAG: 3-methyl-2-oxobutanoate hydroxymethyltransferase [Phycisphaeraceae bacterium]|nr:3-methyl-2-oxobutanoate hydroxymethyltransferase [Phycisphaerales bacterium]MCB9843247.1 3-methyl-2-oxobutanoate hydroxymethyltransferase [Phycisphaeraceae bacterium]